MPISASYLFVLLLTGKLFLLPASTLPPVPAPSDSKPAEQKPEDSTLQLPRPNVSSLPAHPSDGKNETIVEELAPPSHEQSAGPVPIVSAQPFREEAAPMPHEHTPPPARFWAPGAARDPSLPEVDALHREVENLRLEREAILAEETDLLIAKDMHAAKGDEANAQKRIAELVARIAQQAKQAKEMASASRQQGVGSEGARAEGKDNSPPASVEQPDDISKVVTDAPVDPLALAQALFRAGDYAAALNAYRKLDQDDQKPEERTPIQYMMACCLRKLGEFDEASALYREVANTPGNDFLSENAQWYLRTMKERREMEAHLDELRQRRHAMEPSKT